MSAFLLLPEPPSKPEGSLEIVEGTVLQWQGSSNDGGSTILHYIVEQETSSGSKSFECLPKQSTTSETRIDLKNNLLDGNYENVLFRISAVNLKGTSEPHLESIHLNKNG